MRTTLWEAAAAAALMGAAGVSQANTSTLSVRDFTPAVKDAWSALYGAVATTMLSGAEPVAA